MNHVKDISDIVSVRPTVDDRENGAAYAAISLPWTFNRMMLNTGSKGQQQRALNIAKGVAGQHALTAALNAVGVQVETEQKSYRVKDMFDVRVPIGGRLTSIDFKTFNYYTDYRPLGRESFSPDLLVRNRNYDGSDWRKFFPMMIPHTQIGADKEAYCFAIATSVDLRQVNIGNGTSGKYCAFPFGVLLSFVGSTRLIEAREAHGRGFWLELEWRPGVMEPHSADVVVHGDWNGSETHVRAQLERNKSTLVGPLASFASIEVSAGLRAAWRDGTLSLKVAKNDLHERVLSPQRENINVVPAQCEIEFRSIDFCNLFLPDDYTVHVIGWITKNDFLRSSRQYSAWVWPLDSVSRVDNQAWSRITDDDVRSITRAGYGDALNSSRTKINAGWLKTSGRGGGACCYVYPNMGQNSGVKEHNIYVLPADLRPISALGSRSLQ